MDSGCFYMKGDLLVLVYCYESRQISHGSMQARSKAYASGEAKFPWRNHMLQNLRAYLILS